jgi:hypothetical protein
MAVDFTVKDLILRSAANRTHAKTPDASARGRTGFLIFSVTRSNV